MLPALLSREIEILPITKGTPGAWTVFLRDSAGQSISTIPGTATLGAKVWLADGGPVLATPSVAWLSAGDGTIKLDFAANLFAKLPPGRYRILVSVTIDALAYEAWRGELLLIGGPA